MAVAKKAAVPVPKSKAMTERQEELLNTLGAEARRHAQRVREWFSRADRADLEDRFELGQEVKALYEDKAKNGTGHYGLRFVASLCNIFGWDKGVIYGALAVAREFTLEQVAALCERPMANGRLVPYGHLRALVKVTVKRTRDALLDKAVARGWTREELADAILHATKGQKKDGDGRGRPLKPPRDLRGLLRQQGRPAQEFVQRASDVWETRQFSLLGQVKKLTDKEVTQEQVTKLKEHAAALRVLAEKAGEQADEAERAAAYLEKKLATPNEDQGQAQEKASAKDAAGSPNGRHTPA